jgi:hypothetical protein
MQETQQKQWGYALGGHITVTERALKVDYAGKHESVALAEIVGVRLVTAFPGVVNMKIAHRGGVWSIPAVKKKYAQEIVAAIGF